MKDNVNNIFEKQWERNKRAHKDITEYSKKYKNKDYRIRSKSHPNKKREDLREKK